MEKLKNYTAKQRLLQSGWIFGQDHKDEFYEMHFNRIYLEIYTLVERTFRPGTGSNPFRSPWLRDYPDAFNNYIELVCHPDPNSGKWDRLLRDEDERSFTLQAIIMRMLDAQVFSSLLFGADDSHARKLRAADYAYIDADGFRRSQHRACDNEMYLSSKGGQPPHFWEEVDKLATTFVSLFLPIYEYVRDTQLQEPPRITMVYQWFHDLVAYAGWLNVCIRCSPSIVVFEWPMPGMRIDINQVNLSQDIYRHSEANAEFSAQALKMPTKRTLAEGYGARVKIAVLPRITRYTAGRDMEQPESKGTLQYTVMKPHVIYYHGLIKEQQERKLFISRAEYVKRLRDRKATPRMIALCILLMLFLIWWMTSTASGKWVWKGIKERLPGPPAIGRYIRARPDWSET